MTTIQPNGEITTSAELPKGTSMCRLCGRYNYCQIRINVGEAYVFADTKARDRKALCNRYVPKITESEE